MVTVSGNSNPTNPTTINSSELTDKNRRDVGTFRDRLETETSRPRPQPWLCSVVCHYTAGLTGVVGIRWINREQGGRTPVEQRLRMLRVEQTDTFIGWNQCYFSNANEYENGNDNCCHAFYKNENYDDANLYETRIIWKR